MLIGWRPFNYKRSKEKRQGTFSHRSSSRSLP
nr:MAG TPA: hypothetical protein [Bacteriophage sp.]